MRSLIFFTFLLLSTLAWSQEDLSVWPGDTNNDSIVNVRDLLPIGLAYGVEVPERPDPSQAWLEMPAPFIPGQALPNTGINLAHANSDGNFRIDSLDLDAIVGNYDSLIFGPVPFSDQYFPPVPALVSYCPTLRLVIAADSIMVADSFFVTIFLEGFPEGGASLADGILGLAFSLQYETDATALEVFPDSLITFIPNPELELDSLLFVFAVGDTASLFRTLPKGRLDLGVAAKRSNYFRSTVELGKLKFVVDEDLIIRDPNLFIPFSIFLLPESVLILNDREEFFEFCLAEGQRIIIVSEEEPTPPVFPTFDLFPNPAGSVVWLRAFTELPDLTLFDVTGRPLWRRKEMPRGTQRLDLSALSPGYYFLQARTPKGVYVRSFFRQ